LIHLNYLGGQLLLPLPDLPPVVAGIFGLQLLVLAILVSPFIKIYEFILKL